MNYTKTQRNMLVSQSIAEYKCNTCGHTASTAHLADYHQWQAHPFLKKRDSYNNTFYYIETEELFRKFCTYFQVYGKDGVWEGKGWYGTYEEEYYACGGGTDTKAAPILYFMQKAQRDRDHAQREIDSLAEIYKEAERAGKEAPADPAAGVFALGKTRHG